MTKRNIIRTLYRMLLSLSCLVFWSSAFASPSVAFINPSDKNNDFWNSVTLFMQAAAKDLDVNLRVLYGNNNRFDTFKIAKKVLSSDQKPDYLLFIYQASTGKRILDLAEFQSVNTFVFNTDIHPRDAEIVGKPREHYSYWLGHMHPNDIEAGRLLADSLITKAKQRDSKKVSYQILAISGGLDSTPAGHRNQGLENAASRYDDVVINQIVHTNWSGEESYNKSKTLLKRYPHTSIIWGASDDLALSATRAGEDGSLYSAGGIDWTAKGLQLVKDGALQASVGGHFMEGGWSLVMLHDHYHGHDFKSSGMQYLTNMQVIDDSNVNRYLDKVQSSNYENVDFKQFSKVHNKKVQKYDFSLNTVFKSLEEK